MVWRAIWLILKLLASALLVLMGVGIAYSAVTKREFAVLGLGAFFVALAVLPWLNWGGRRSPLGAVQPVQSGPSPVTVTVIALGLIAIGGALVALAVARWQRAIVVADDETVARIVTFAHHPVEFVLRQLFGLSLGASLFLGGFVLLYKALPRLGVSPQGRLRAFASPHVPDSVLVAFYVCLGIFLVLLHLLPLYGG